MKYTYEFKRLRNNFVLNISKKLNKKELHSLERTYGKLILPVKIEKLREL